VLTIEDWSGSLESTRAASETELVVESGSGAAAEIWATGTGSGAESRTIRLVWVGEICDQAARLIIDHEVANLTVEVPEGRVCDAMGVGRGVVLTFGHAVNVTVIQVHLQPAD
jgi:hypothetical protein